MVKARIRAAVAPLRRPDSNLPQRLQSADALVEAMRPEDPMVCMRPRTFTATARGFVRRFPGDVLYAVKCNPEPTVLRALWAGGVRHFDCASIGEVRLVRHMFAGAEIHYMHPVKGPAAIREAYSSYGVRDFSLDALEELHKIVASTDGAEDLGLFIRLAPPKCKTLYDLSGKFGAQFDDAVEILRRARPFAARLGVCFHVGSQCMEPEAYERGLALAAAIVEKAGVALDIVDVGGGFPVSYPDVTPPPLGLYFEAIERGMAAFGGRQPRLWCEPGRALVAAGASVVVRVMARRGDVLHVNDGVYGSLSDAGVPKWRFPVRLIRPSGDSTESLTPFSFYGPTCDSADFMAGPFMLPTDVQEGDWIELGQLGAYGTSLRTGFNGFERTLMAEVLDPPLIETPGHIIPLPRRRAVA